MTMIQTMPVTCPRCGKESSTNIYNSVNASLDPSLKEKLLSGSLIKWQCEACGDQRLNAFPLLYHDSNQGILIQWMHPAYAPTQKDLAAALPPQEVCNNFRSLKNNYRFRVVREFDDLVEKIRIFDAGFDDRAIEWVKYVFAEKATEAAPGQAQAEKIGVGFVQPRFRRCVEMEGVRRLDIAGAFLMKMPGLPPISLSTYPTEDMYLRALGYLDTHLPWPEATNGHFYLIDRGYIQRAWARLPSINERQEDKVEPQSSPEQSTKGEQNTAKPWWKFW